MKNFLRYSYDANEKRIVKYPVESGDDLYKNALPLQRGYENKMTHSVNQLTERFIFSNGDELEQLSFYYPGQNYVNPINPS